MNKIRNTYQLFCFIVLVLGGVIISQPSMAQEVGLSVVANTTGVPDELTSEEMKKIFLGKKQTWGNNQYIKLAMLKPDTKVGSAVSEKLYGMTPNELK